LRRSRTGRKHSCRRQHEFQMRAHAITTAP
jgi:hypothetical protein